jgi:hypothetical protein
MTRLFWIALIVPLAGCVGPILAPGDIFTTYIPAELSRDAARAPIGVAVRAAQGDDAAARVVAALPRSGPARGNFAAAGAPTTATRHHIVVDFAPAADQTPDALCQGAASGGAPTAGSVSAALCLGVTPLSWAVARDQRGAAPGEPGFADTIAQLGLALMPNDNPHRRDGRGEGLFRMPM